MNQIKTKKNFTLLLLGQIVSVLGSSLLRFALSLYVLDRTGRADVYATLYAISSIPLLLGPIGGALADRFNRRNLMVIGDMTNCIVALVAGLLLLFGNPSIAVIGIIMVLLSMVGSMDTPTVTASIPLLVNEDKLESANGVVNGVQALSNVAAPILGGIIYGVMGVKNIVFISCIAFFLTAVLEMFIKIPYTKRNFEGSIVPTIANDMKVGFSYVVKKPFILKSVVLAAFLNLILTPFFVVGGPIILRVTMNSSNTMYGVGMSCINFATILGALSIGILAKKMSIKKLYKWLLLIAILFVPMAVSITPYVLNLGYYPSFLLFMICAIPVAMVMTVISIYVITKVQKVTPDENLGKVMAIITAVSQCAAPIGQFIFGIIFEKSSTKMFLPTLFVSISMIFMAVITQITLRKESETI